MYEKNGERYFIVDGHIHFWDGSPENQANKYGKGFIECFYDYHRNLSPAESTNPTELRSIRSRVASVARASSRAVLSASSRFRSISPVTVMAADSSGPRPTVTVNAELLIRRA